MVAVTTLLKAQDSHESFKSWKKKNKTDAETREKLGDPNSLDKSSTARDRIFLVRAFPDPQPVPN